MNKCHDVDLQSNLPNHYQHILDDVIENPRIDTDQEQDGFNSINISPSKEVLETEFNDLTIG